MDISAGSGKSLINVVILAGIYQSSDIHLTYLHLSTGPLTVQLFISSVRSSLYYQRPSFKVRGRQMFHSVHNRVSLQSVLTVMMMLRMILMMILMLVMMMMLKMLTMIISSGRPADLHPLPREDEAQRLCVVCIMVPMMMIDEDA